MKITLAICTNRGIRPKTAQCLLDLVNYSKHIDVGGDLDSSRVLVRPAGKVIDFHILVAERGYTTAENRNYCVVQAQRNQSDYLFFIDDDMTFEKTTLEKLLSHGKEVIGVNSYSRCLPLSSTVGLMNKEGKYMHPEKHTAWETRIPNELFKCYFVGAGVLLIDMKVFEKIDKPYFAFSTDENGQIVDGEDGSFCANVKKAGMDIWCDPQINVGHLGEYEYKKIE